MFVPDARNSYLLEMFIGSSRLFLLCEWTHVHVHTPTPLLRGEVGFVISPQTARRVALLELFWASNLIRALIFCGTCGKSNPSRSRKDVPKARFLSWLLICGANASGWCLHRTWGPDGRRWTPCCVGLSQEPWPRPWSHLLIAPRSFSKARRFSFQKAHSWLFSTQRKQDPAKFEWRICFTAC